MKKYDWGYIEQTAYKSYYIYDYSGLELGHITSRTATGYMFNPGKYLLSATQLRDIASFVEAL